MWGELITRVSFRVVGIGELRGRKLLARAHSLVSNTNGACPVRELKESPFAWPEKRVLSFLKAHEFIVLFVLVFPFLGVRMP